MWNFYFRVYAGAVKEKSKVRDFLQALVRHLRLPLLVVWDRHASASQPTTCKTTLPACRSWIATQPTPAALRAGN